ncbi:MAG: UDP-N-acetyl-D-mannosaminuronate dehydrogenase, partial [Flavobacteriales bacterium]
KKGAYDAVIVAVNHQEYDNYTEDDFKLLMNDEQGVIVDLKGTYRRIIKDLVYWSL